MNIDDEWADGRDKATGRFVSGNSFWKARSSHGPKPKFTKPDDLWGACCEYFEWVEQNPLYTDQIISFQGAATHVPVAKMRAMTIAGLCLFLDISHETWVDWRKNRPDLSDVITRAEAIIYEQKFTGAAAELLNPNIIARDLGLAEKKETTTTIIDISDQPATEEEWADSYAGSDKEAG